MAWQPVSHCDIFIPLAAKEKKLGYHCRPPVNTPGRRGRILVSDSNVSPGEARVVVCVVMLAAEDGKHKQ